MASRDSNELPEVFKLIRLRDLCRAFINENKIECVDDARYVVSENPSGTFRLISSICNQIGYYGQER